MTKTSVAILLILTLPAFGACRKLVEVPPPSTQLSSGNVYDNDQTAAAVLTGLYASMDNTSPLSLTSVDAISLVTGLSADELSLYGAPNNGNLQLDLYYANRLASGSWTGGASIWNDLYSKIYIVNIALERMGASVSLTSSVRQQLMGEAKFMRAFFYFLLVNLYGDVPLAISSDYTTNSGLARTPSAEVYKQVIADLKDAQELLTSNYIAADAKTTTSERLRPNKWAATALLARAYLYTGDWDSAIAQASAVIANTDMYGLDSLNNVFLKNSHEAIWQLQPVNIGWNTEDARIFILPTGGPTANGNYPVYLSPELLQTFEPGDRRRVAWIDSVVNGNTTFYFPFKYKSATLNAPVTEYVMMMRLSEQYLIRAESLAELNNITEAQSDLNYVRRRAWLSPTAAVDKNSLLVAILHERQTELFTEWGQRWLDLKRTGAINLVMPAVDLAKGSNWDPNWQWYPIPQYDITQDPHLNQNPGY